ncbi:MAG: response regulator [Velocimicrobium sp.]
MYENYSVLFVDDEVNILNSLKRGLIDEEYSCHFASSGSAALRIMEQEKIAVIVTDMRMPEMDGLHLLKIIKGKWPRTVGIVLSGYTQLQQILATINQIDIFKYITKPWKLEEEFKVILYKALDYYILQEENEANKIALQKKNEAYQNIFRNMENIMDNAKNSCYALGVLGKSILNYNRSLNVFLSEEFSDYQEIIFENYITAVTGEKKEYSGETFEWKGTQLIQSKIGVSQIKNKLDPKLKIKFSPKMVEATLISCITVFSKEWRETGLNLTYALLPNKGVTIYLISQHAFADKKEEKMLVVNQKEEFLNAILQETLKRYRMDFGVITKNERFAIIISIAINQE